MNLIRSKQVLKGRLRLHLQELSMFFRIQRQTCVHTCLTGALRLLSFSIALVLVPAFAQTDPGARPGPPGAGGALPNLTSSEFAAFNLGKTAFEEIDSVSGTLSDGS